MKKSKKIIVLVMACVMLFGATLTVNAACSHSPYTSTSSYTDTASCGHAMGCTIKRPVTVNNVNCRLCGIHITTTTSKGDWTHSMPFY